MNNDRDDRFISSSTAGIIFYPDGADGRAFRIDENGDEVPVDRALRGATLGSPLECAASLRAKALAEQLRLSLVSVRLKSHRF